MGLNFLRSSEEHKLSPGAKLLLESYMAGATKEIGYDFKGSARRKAGKYAADFYRSGEAKGLTEKDVKTMEKQVSEELKQYGWKEKLNYHVNGLATFEAFDKGHYLRSLRTISGVGALAVAATVAGIQKPADVGILAAELGVMLSKGAVLCAAGVMNDPEHKIEAYTDLKHAQLALKQLRREFRKAERAQDREEVAKLFAAGYGQPSGGLIQNPVQMAKLKNQGR